MSFATAKYITLTDKQWPIFTWGLVTNTERWMLPYKNTPDAQNFRITERGISIREGFYQFWDSLGATDYPRGIAAYYRSNPTNDKLIVRYNKDATHKLLEVNPTTWVQTSILTSALITSDNRMNFVSTNDSLYCMNWVDEMGKLNWTTYTVPSLWITLKPAFGAFFDNSLFVSWDATAPNSLYKSGANSPETFSWTGSDLFTSSYPITWLATTLQSLYVFSKNTIDVISSNSIKQIWSTLVYTSLPLEANEWAANHESIAVYWKECYYLSKSNKLKKIAPWQSAQWDVIDVSHRNVWGIEKTMNQLDSDQSKAFSYVIPESSLIKWHLKSKGSNYNDICIVYNVLEDAFMPDTKKIFYAWVNYNTKNYTVSQIEPKIYRDEEGFTDDDTPIQFFYETKDIDLWEPTMLKELWQERTFLWINSLAVVDQETFRDWQLVDSRTIDRDDLPYDIDWIGTQEIWTFAIGEEADLTKVSDLVNISIIRDKWNLQQRWQVFKVRWSCSALWARVLLQQFTPRIELLPQLTASTR